MPLSPPAGKNYQSPLTSVPSKALNDPLEGPRQVSLEFDWTTMGQQFSALSGGFGVSGGYSVYVNLQNNATINFSQIASVVIDNSNCGSIVQLIFQDTGEVVTVDAFAPRTITPVFSGATQFYAVAYGATPNDVTRVQLLNFLPPPVALPETPAQISTATFNQALSASLNTNVAIVPATVTGTLQDLRIGLTVGTPPAAVAEVTVGISDGTSRALVTLEPVFVGTGTPIAQLPLLDLQGVNFRFTNGLFAAITTTAAWPAASSSLSFFTTYTSP